MQQALLGAGGLNAPERTNLSERMAGNRQQQASARPQRLLAKKRRLQLRGGRHCSTDHPLPSLTPPPPHLTPRSPQPRPGTHIFRCRSNSAFFSSSSRFCFSSKLLRLLTVRPKISMRSGGDEARSRSRSRSRREEGAVLERERDRDSRRRLRLLSRDLERFRARSFSRERDRERLRFFLLCFELLVCLERDELRLRDRPIPAERKGRAGDRPATPAPSTSGARGRSEETPHASAPPGLAPRPHSLYRFTRRGERAGPENSSRSGRRQDGGPNGAVTLCFRPTMHRAALQPFALPPLRPLLRLFFRRCTKPLGNAR